MPAEAKTTTNRKEIQQWVEERGGNPAKVKGTQILRIDYPGYAGQEQIDLLNEQVALVDLEIYETKLEELDLEAALNFG
jgi:hypothetical protein